MGFVLRKTVSALFLSRTKTLGLTGRCFSSNSTISLETYSVSDKLARIGITAYAIEKLGEVVFVDVGSVGKFVKQGDDMATLESVKAVGEVYAPVNGTVVRVNPDILSNNEAALRLINQDAEGEGWLAEIEMNKAEDLLPLANPSLMSHEKYLECCEAESAEEHQLD